MWRIALVMLMFAGLAMLFMGSKSTRRQQAAARRHQARAERLTNQALQEAERVQRRATTEGDRAIQDAMRAADRIRMRPHNAPPEPVRSKSKQRDVDIRPAKTDTLSADTSEFAGPIGDVSVTIRGTDVERLADDGDWQSDPVVNVDFDRPIERFAARLHRQLPFGSVALSAIGVLMFMLLGALFMNAGKHGAPAWPRRAVAVILFGMVCALLAGALH